MARGIRGDLPAGRATGGGREPVGPGGAGGIDVRRVSQALRRAGARLAVPGDGEYPERLLDLPDPPACLFLRGRPPPGAGGRPEVAVAVVGARACSPYGREVAEGIGAGVAAAGVAVVSGAAIGIDGAAHRGALRVGGPTVAVLGSGIDTAYPQRHRGLIDRIAEAGSVLSEYPPGVKPEPRRFPARNRIVAGLARAVVVVEGAPGSGSLITAEFAQDLGRDVLAVPGPVTSPLSQAPHELIRDGGTLVRGAEDVLAWLDLWGPRAEAGERPPVPEDLLGRGSGPGGGGRRAGDRGRRGRPGGGGDVRGPERAHGAGAPGDPAVRGRPLRTDRGGVGPTGPGRSPLEAEGMPHVVAHVAEAGGELLAGTWRAAAEPPAPPGPSPPPAR
ncbi:MAG: DNA-processing protein DprA [Actinomycetota bacterium]